MLSDSELFALIFLVIMAVTAIVLAFRYRSILNSCMNNEGPYCPQFTCRDGNPATRPP